MHSRCVHLTPERVRPIAASFIATTLAAFAIATPTATAQPGEPGFALLNHPDEGKINLGQVFRQFEYEPGEPLVLTYAIDADFLDNEPLLDRQRIVAAVERALQSWSDATNGMIVFEPSPWDAVLNSGSGPPGAFVGPPFEEWLDDFLACEGDPACQNALDPPGWGAHIDFFSRPPGWSYSFGGIAQPYQMTQCNLGFAAWFPDGSKKIAAVDVILNTKWDWTDDEDLVTPIDRAIAQQFGAALRAAGEPTQGPNQPGIPFGADFAQPATSRQAGPQPIANSCDVDLVVDLETVVLHEVGHALGLDHPNESAPNGSVLFDPYLFDSIPLGNWRADAVMHAFYTGVKRDLLTEDIGGVTYLYPPILGDLDGDTQVTVADYAAAFLIVTTPGRPEPYDTFALDLCNRDAIITVDEVTKLAQWVTPGDTSEPRGAALTPTTMTLSFGVDPEDIGVGDPVAVAVLVDNPDGREVVGYEVSIVYDPAIFSNPQVLDGTWFQDGAEIPTIIDPAGEVHFGEIAPFAPETGASGSLAVVVFDVDVAAAAAAGAYTLDYNVTLIPVANPYTHNFGLNPSFPEETLIVTPFTGVANNYDVNGDATVDAEDLFRFESDPTFDVDGDGTRTAADRELIQAAVRRAEAQNTGSGR